MSKVTFPSNELPKDGTYKLTFGKYQGLTVEEVPSDYLLWLSAHSENVQLIKVCDAELSYRTQHHCHSYSIDERESGGKDLSEQYS